MSNSKAPVLTPWSRRALIAIVITTSVLCVNVFLFHLLPKFVDVDNVSWLSWANNPSVAYWSAIVGLPIVFIISLFGLHRQRHSADGKAEAYHALARELSQVANKSEIVINAIGDGVVATDNKGVIQLINPAAQTIIGWGKQEAQGLDYRSVIKLTNDKNAELDTASDPVQQILQGKPSVSRNDLLLLTSSGKKINVSLLVSPVGNFNNGSIIVFRDITNEVSENNQRTEFISTASHEMRTPVASIEGYLGLALNPATAQIDDKARLYLTKAHESAQHLGRLFQDLLDVSKSEDGRLKNEPKLIELVDFVRESTSALELKAQEHNLTLVFQPDVTENSNNSITPIYHVEVDPDHLRETLSNLIENAIKYTKEGSVTVNVTGNNNNAVVSIADTGIGIAKEDIPHLFQKFYRIDNTDTREIGGTGLGLYLCRRLVESMNGRLWVESEAGKGSTFFIELARMTSKEVERQQNQFGIPSA